MNLLRDDSRSIAFEAFHIFKVRDQRTRAPPRQRPGARPPSSLSPLSPLPPFPPSSHPSHVFKVFVANPNKAPAVAAVLAANREKLLRYLEGFQADREDEQFQEEKGVIAREIAELEAPGEGGAGAGGGEGA